MQHGIKSISIGTNHRFIYVDNLHQSKDSQFVFLLSLGSNRETHWFLTRVPSCPQQVRQCILSCLPTITPPRGSPRHSTCLVLGLRTPNRSLFHFLFYLRINLLRAATTAMCLKGGKWLSTMVSKLLWRYNTKRKSMLSKQATHVCVYMYVNAHIIYTHTHTLRGYIH